MKELKTTNLRFMQKKIRIFSVLFFGIMLVAVAQEDELTAQKSTIKDTVTSGKRLKLDGIAAVIGDYVILDSDIEKTLIDLQNQGAST